MQVTAGKRYRARARALRLPAFLLLATGSACVGAAPVAAQAVTSPRREPTSVSVTGAEACIDVERLGASVAQRSRRLLLQPGSGGLVVHVSKSGATWQARITFGPVQGGAERNLSASTCTALSDAVGFVIAVTLDPPSAPSSAAPSSATASSATANSATASSATPDTPSQSSPSGAAVGASGAQAQEAGTATPLPANDQQPTRLDEDAGRRLLELPTYEPRETDGPSAPQSYDIAPRVGAGLSTWVGPAPDPLWGALVVVDIERVLRSPSAVWFGGGRLSFGVTLPSRVRTQDGTATFQLFTASAALCPLAVGGRVVHIDVCATGLLGALDAAGSSTDAPARHTRPYAALGGDVNLDAKLSESLWATLGAGAAAALVRDSFQFEPVVFHRASPLVVSVRLTLGWSF